MHQEIDAARRQDFDDSDVSSDDGAMRNKFYSSGSTTCSEAADEALSRTLPGMCTSAAEGGTFVRSAALSAIGMPSGVGVPSCPCSEVPITAS